MKDYTLCVNVHCPHKEECKRYTEEIEENQSYSNEFKYPVCFWDKSLNKNDS